MSTVRFLFEYRAIRAMVEIQRALTEDLTQFVAMEQAIGTREFITPYSLEEHAQKIADSELVYLRILDAAALVGFLILGLDSDGISVEFRRIVVSTKGQGIGQAAMRQLEHFCRTDLHRTRIWLDVFATNNRARHLYEKLGYVQFGNTELNGKPVMLYEKAL